MTALTTAIAIAIEEMIIMAPDRTTMVMIAATITADASANPSSAALYGRDIRPVSLPFTFCT